jgi:hypothetical protein
MKQMTWAEFSKEYCTRQEQTPDGLARVLRTQSTRYNSEGFMLLQCEMLDSSRLGEYVILGFGGTHTFKTIPTHPVSPRGLASDMSMVKGWIPATDLPE